MIVTFLCGCRHEIHTQDTEDIGWWKEVSTDREGFLICVAHRMRRENWAALPEGSAKQLANWKYASSTPIEIEQHLIYGKPLPERILADVDFSAQEDRRDNRDPEAIGAEILAAAGAKGNGHAEGD